MLKKCFKCNEIKNLREFYVHKEMVDGHLGKCKECTKKDVTEHRNKNVKRIRKYDLSRAKLPHRKKYMSAYGREYRKSNPLKRGAMSLLNSAIRSGKIRKPKNCTMCNEEVRMYGHHTDYYKPLDVIWVCQVCHKKLHKELNED